MRIRRGIYVVPMKEIIYMEKERRRMRVHTQSRDYYYYVRFVDVMPHLDGRFTRSHRSFILNMDRIVRLENRRIVMDDGSEIFFGKATFQRLKKDYERYSLWKRAWFEEHDPRP